MTERGTRGAYRMEDRVQLPHELQKELIEKAAAKFGNCQELAKHLNIPKSSVHYYRIGRLTMPVSLLERMLGIATDDDLRKRIEERGVTKDRTWANEYAVSVYREMCRDKLRLPTRKDLDEDDELRRKAASIISYVLTEGSIWMLKEKWGEYAVNITFGAHETDLYNHFRQLCREVFRHDIGPAQPPGNNAKAIRGFIYSRFIAEWLIENGIRPGDKSAQELHFPNWIMNSVDRQTLIAALQPWCDGEGGVCRSGSQGRAAFALSQSRHTNLDVCTIPWKLATKKGRAICRGIMHRINLHDIPLDEYCHALCRSEILDDVLELFRRLGLRPRQNVTAIRFKEDGFWSCIWTLGFTGEDTQRLLQLRLVTQARKFAALSQK